MKNSMKVQRRKQIILKAGAFSLWTFSGKLILHSEDSNSLFFLSALRSIFHKT